MGRLGFVKDASSHWAMFDAPVLDPTEHPPGRGIAERVGEALGCAVAIDVWRDVGWSIDVTVEGEALAIFISELREGSTWLLCCARAESGFLSGAFRRPEPRARALRALAERVDAILHAPFHSVKWYPDGWRGDVGDRATEHP